MDRLAVLLMTQRLPWDDELPVAELSDAPFPKLVISGGHSDQLELVSDELARRLGPRARREVIRGRGHLVQRTGDAFNDTLEAFMLEAEQGVAP
jgi:hypothetical protein